MFTGIITNTGVFKRRIGSVVEISAPPSMLKSLKIGDSIAVSGVCLTIIKKTANSFQADVMEETWNKTMLGSLKSGALLNLELPLRAGDLLSGHIVQGHVDGTAKILNIKNKIITFDAPKNISAKLVIKGSVAINGIALTVISISGGKFTVGIIPHTWNNTSLREAKPGDLVNIEVDHGVRTTGKIAIVSSSFHKDITEALKKNCIQTLVKNGVALNQIKIVDVPGALEIPLIAQKLAKQKTYDAIIALGVIHKGETYHFQQVADACIRGCMEVSEDYEIPVVYEVLAVYKIKDAIERAEGKKYNRGKDAAETALAMIKILKNL